MAQGREGEAMTAEPIPLLQAYFDLLPPIGSTWPKHEQRAWLEGMERAFCSIFKLPDQSRLALLQVLVEKLRQVPSDQEEKVRWYLDQITELRAEEEP